jgi:hypothetical protein
MKINIIFILTFSKTTKFLNCKTSTPTTNERAENITDSEVTIDHLLNS